MSRSDVLFDIQEVSKHFPVRSGPLNRVSGSLKAVDRVNLHIPPNTILGLVGESGSGKTTLGRLLVKLVEPTSGRIHFEGKDITGLTRNEMKWFRKRVQMLFQDPFLSLNPRRTIFKTLAYPLIVHGLAKKGELAGRVRDLLAGVGLEPAIADAYPHELSGGERQRVSLAAALSVEPDFICCDEPVSVLDVSARAQVLNLLRDVQKEQKLSMLIISHDLSAVEYICDEVAVMYLGSIIERATKDRLFETSAHPYTEALMSAIPEPDPDIESARKEIILEGEIPSPVNPPTGCKFHTRCPKKIGSVCETVPPEPCLIADGHQVTCHLFSEGSAHP